MRTWAFGEQHVPADPNTQSAGCVVVYAERRIPVPRGQSPLAQLFGGTTYRIEAFPVEALFDLRVQAEIKRRAGDAARVRHQPIKQLIATFRVAYEAGKFRDTAGAPLSRERAAAVFFSDLAPRDKTRFKNEDAAIATLWRGTRGARVR